MFNMKDRNLGRFYISARFYASIQVDQGLNLFKNILVLEAKPNLLNDVVEYVGLSKYFRNIRQGEIIPTYKAIFNTNSPYPKWEELKEKYNID